jgi:hypothetical protein
MKKFAIQDHAIDTLESAIAYIRSNARVILVGHEFETIAELDAALRAVLLDMEYSEDPYCNPWLD